MSASASTELKALLGHLSSYGSVLVCFSGGVDSALVLAAAVRALGRERVLGVTAVSSSLPVSEKQLAETTAQAIGAEHRFLESKERLRPGYVKNGPDRCFHCKSELYSITEQEARRAGFQTVANGVNKDDAGDYRPGLEAASNAGVRSPLLELGFGKNTVRALARELELPVAEKPAAACLASRLPYGTEVTQERLQQVEQMEAELRKLGFEHVRVRWHSTVARIEVSPEQIAQLVEPKTARLVHAAGVASGFTYVTVDILGYRQGSHNAVLSGRALRVLSH